MNLDNSIKDDTVRRSAHHHHDSTKCDCSSSVKMHYQVDKTPEGLGDDLKESRKMSRTSFSTVTTVSSRDSMESEKEKLRIPSSKSKDLIGFKCDGNTTISSSSAPKNCRELQVDNDPYQMKDESMFSIDDGKDDHSRIRSICANDAQVEAIQEETEVAAKENSWIRRRRQHSERRALQRPLQDQVQKLRDAHRSLTFLRATPDEREAAKQLSLKPYPSPTGEGFSVSINFSGKGSKLFYTGMKSFSDFRDITNDDYFQLVPENWYVVITDVKGSTKAIEAGRYRDVNTIGAASISVVMQLLEEDFPFVFGGDGATLLIPPTDIGRVLEVLLRLQRLAEEQFQLGLRVGHISVHEVKKSGGKVEVAKHELTAGRCISIFRGGGLTVAESMIKGEEHKYCSRYNSLDDVELDGLSCRWNEIPSKRGRIMSLLVCARDDAGECTNKVYDHVIQELDRIYEGRLDEANPVNPDLMSYQSISQNYAFEKRFQTEGCSSAFIGRVAEIFLAVGIFKHGLDPKFFDPKRYFKSMRCHADHRKFDDCLRMILDCSDEQAEEIENLMEELCMDQKLHYGIHLSNAALMTCYLQDLEDGKHIHFIDGGDGGYAMAAKQLKAQIKSCLL